MPSCARRAHRIKSRASADESRGECGCKMGLSGRTLITAVYGDPIEHSLSPAMHNAAYEGLGIDRAYVAFHVKPESLRDAVRAIAAMGLLGVNLTLPHKERAFRMVDGLSAEAKTLGAVNSIINRRGKLLGDNTDARGLEADLRELGIAVRGRPVVIIGAGGAASAAVLACIRLGANRILIANRTRPRATRLAKRFAKAELQPLRREGSLHMQLLLG